MVAAVDEPIQFGAWAKQSITNGNPTIYAFLEKYLAKAYIVTNGTLTTNQTGVLSEYGEFFPTDPGTVLLTTKTNADGVQGQVAVQVVGLFADVNHNGPIDTSFSGPDACTPARPFRFWVNDDDDYGDVGGDDIPGLPAATGGVPNGLSDQVNGVRDLVDFFPVFVDIAPVVQAMQTNAAYANIQFVLSQPDGALNFLYTDLPPGESSAYLTNTLLAQTFYAYAPVTQITSKGVTLDPSQMYSLSGGGGILVEAWTNTANPLVLDVVQSNVVLAEAVLPLSITGVEQMFRHKI